MQDGDVLLRRLQQLVVHNVAALAAVVALLVRETLPLYTGDVHQVGYRQRRLHVVRLGDVRALRAQLRGDLLRHLQLVRAGEDHLVAQLLHEVAQAVDGAAVLQISQESDGLTTNVALFLANGVDIQQGLGGVLAGAVAAVDHRMLGNIGGGDCRTLHRMAHDNGVHVAVHGADGVLQRLALGLRGGLGVRHGDTLGAGAVDGRLEAQAGPGGGLEEQTGHYAAV